MTFTASIKTVFSNLLTKNLPDRIKRLVFLASLLPRLCENQKFDKSVIHKLNQVMALSLSGDRALDLPIQLSKIIWRGDHGSTIVYPVREPEVEGVINRVLKTTPAWLQYQDQVSMRADLSKLLHNRDMIVAS